MTSPFSCRAREVTCHYGHVNRFCYLLTYLLTYHQQLHHQHSDLNRQEQDYPHGRTVIACCCRTQTQPANDVWLGRTQIPSTWKMEGNAWQWTLTCWCIVFELVQDVLQFIVDLSRDYFLLNRALIAVLTHILISVIHAGKQRRFEGSSKILLSFITGPVVEKIMAVECCVACVIMNTWWLFSWLLETKWNSIDHTWLMSFSQFSCLKKIGVLYSVSLYCLVQFMWQND